MTAPWTDPTHSEAPRPRKPRRLGLWIPWGVALALAIGWSLWWLWAMHAIVAGMDATAAKLRGAGWRVAWASRQTGGYPFRLDVDVTGLDVADPSGWAVQVPALKTEAYAFAPTHWVFYLPGGRMTVTRPGDGPFDVTGGVLRGSVSGVGEGVPRIALEGDDVRFAAQPGAAPVLLAAAKNIQVYTRPGPDDQGAAYLSIQGGAAAPGIWLAVLAGDGSVDLTTDATFGHASAFVSNLHAATLAWTQAGGELDVQRLDLAAGDQHFIASSVRLGVDAEGRIIGQLPLTTRAGPVWLDFYQGGAWIGAHRVAAAPRLF